MSCRIDTVSLIAGACVVGATSLGVLGSAVPSTGEYGPGYVYNDLALPADAGKEVRGLILTVPSAGTFAAYEDSSFTLAGAPDGIYTFTYRLFVDGADLGTSTATITIGAPVGATVTVTIAEPAGADVFAAAVAIGSAPSAVTVTVSIAESGSDVFAANLAQGSVSAMTEPVTLAEAKAAANIDASITVFDSKIIGLITAARLVAEHETGREYVAKTKRYTFVDWPTADHVMYTFQPTAVAISYWDGSAWVALDSGAYGYFEQDLGTGIGPAIGASWPTLGQVIGGPRVRVDVAAGSDAPATTTPENVKLYIKAVVVHWLQQPAAASERSLTEVPFLVRLLDDQRLWN